VLPALNRIGARSRRVGILTGLRRTRRRRYRRSVLLHGNEKLSSPFLDSRHATPGLILRSVEDTMNMSFEKNYSFLDDYKDGEMKMLKDEIKETRDGSRAEQLAKKLKSMESQRQSQRNKDKVREVLEQHKKEEREKVKQGKKAYFLKPSEAKTRVLQEEFSKLSDKQVEKTMARKQKRKTQKERKNMPWARREF